MKEYDLICSRCGKNLTNKIEVYFSIRTFRKKDSGVWESIANLDLNSKEILCDSCFQLLIDALEELNDYRNNQL